MTDSQTTKELNHIRRAREIIVKYAGDNACTRALRNALFELENIIPQHHARQPDEKEIDRSEKAFRCGKILRITKEDLQAFLASHYDQDVEPRRAKYRTNPTSRRVGKAIRDAQKQNATETLRQFGVIR